MRAAIQASRIGRCSGSPGKVAPNTGTNTANAEDEVRTGQSRGGD
jgi:hypothetical protein